MGGPALALASGPAFSAQKPNRRAVDGIVCPSERERAAKTAAGHLAHRNRRRACLRKRSAAKAGLQRIQGVIRYSEKVVWVVTGPCLAAKGTVLTPCSAARHWSPLRPHIPSTGCELQSGAVVEEPGLIRKFVPVHVFNDILNQRAAVWA